MITYPTNTLQKVTLLGRCEQRNLPSGYTQVEYISNDSDTKYNTNLLPQDGDEIELRFKVTQSGISNYFFQSRTNSSPIYGMGGSGSTSGIVAAFAGSSITTSITRIENHIYYVKASFINGTITLYIKDETSGVEDTGTTTYTFTATQSPYFIWGNSYQTLSATQPLYFLKLTNGGATRLNLVSARQNNTVGFYDLATNTFISQMTKGSITAGADVVPTPDNPMDIVCNNGVLKVRHQSGLPLGYTLLEYIESSGTQYIDTGYKPNANTSINVKYYPAISSVFMCIYGTQDSITLNRFYGLISSTQFRIQINSNGQTSNFWGINKNSTFIESVNGTFAQTQGIVDLTVDNVNKKVSIKSDEYTGDISFSGTVFGDNLNCTYNMLLFSRGTTGTAENNFSGRIYSFSIKDNDTLVQNLIPCRRNSDNVLGMYDLVSGQFFTNAGTGDFIAGTPVSDPVEIYTEGTQEVVTDNLGNTANAERLLAVGDYKDTQSVLDGGVTKNIGIKVLDGTELFYSGQAHNVQCIQISKSELGISSDTLPVDSLDLICTHYKAVNGSDWAQSELNTIKVGNGYLFFNTQYIQDSTSFKAYLADQYNAGTPVIIVYPLAEPTTEQVAPQPLSGNTATVTAGSIDNLPIESSTIAELQKRYIGDKEVKRVYIGDNLVFKGFESQALQDNCFLTRDTGGGSLTIDANKGNVLNVKGDSKAWNQLVWNGDFSDGTNGWIVPSTSSVSNHKITVTWTGVYSRNGITQVVNWNIVGHKYYVKATIKNLSGEERGFVVGDVYTDNNKINGTFSNNEEKTLKKIITRSGSYLTDFYIASALTNVECTAEISNISIIDLTLLGYPNIDSTTPSVAQVEAWLATHVGLKDYYPYDAGSILNTKMLGIQTTAADESVLDTKYIDVQHIYGKLNGSGDYVQVFPDGLRGAGSVTDVLDIKNDRADVKVKTVDLGARNWTYNSTKNYFMTPFGNNSYFNFNITCARYMNISSIGAQVPDMSIARTYQEMNGILIKDTRYSDGASLKSALNGVILNYALDTPLTYTNLVYMNSPYYADYTPVSGNYLCDIDGTESIIVPDSVSGEPTSMAPMMDVYYREDY